MVVQTVPELLRHVRQTHRNGDAFLVKRDGAWMPVSIEEVATRVDQAAALLSSRGVRKGDRVAILSESRLEWAIVDLALLSCGAVSVPVYPTLPGGQIAPLLLDSGSCGVFVSDSVQRGKIESIRGQVPSLRWIHCFEEERLAVGGGGAGEGPIPGEGDGRTGEAAQTNGMIPGPVAIGPDDLATIIYTSGTTGVPKGVMLTHGNIAAEVRLALRCLEVSSTDVYLSFLPLSHVFERCSGFYTMLYAGTTIAYAESLEQMPRNLEEVRPTVLMAVPRFYDKLLARAREVAAGGGPRKQSIFRWAYNVAVDWARYVDEGRTVPIGLGIQHAIADLLVFQKLSTRLGGRVRLLVSGGAPLNREVAEFFCGAGLPIHEGYGLSETSSAIAVNTFEKHRIGTVGPVLPEIEVRIADDGEILVRGPVVMSGYWNRPEDTAAALQGGWFHTGDIGEIDSDGFLRITDRKKDVIVTSGGKKVAPQPIEAVLRASPCIVEALVVGEGQRFIGALIVAASGVSYEQVQAEVDRANSALAQFEQIRRFELIPDDLTIENGALTPSLKVKRKVVLERHRDLVARLFSESPAGAA